MKFLISQLPEPLFNVSYFFICYASFSRQCSNLPHCSPDFMPLEELFAQVKNDAAWHFCQDPELMVEEAFFHVTDIEVKNYIHHAEYF